MATSDKALTVWQSLPVWARGTIAIVGTAGALFIAYKGYRAYEKWQLDKDAKAVTNDAKKTYKDLLSKGKKLSFPESNYSSTANTITTLLNGCESILSELQVVEAVMRVTKNPVDWFYLVSEFGTREIEDCVYGKTNYDLITLLSDQLDTSIPVINVRVYNGRMYVGVDTIVPLRDHLKKMGVTI
mgnify:CR=1 FL=1